MNSAAEILGLDPLIKRKPKQLSGGQRQRVALGRAIVREPAAFLMDEPLSNLDAKLRVATRAEILKLQRRLGTTTIYVTHDQVEAMTMGDRIAVMNLGELQQVGSPKELYERPTNLFVAGFIGSPAMNLIDVERASQDGRAILRHDGFALEIPERFTSTLRSDRVVAGFRPEHLTVVDSGRSDDRAELGAVVDVVEYLGDELLAHLHSGEVDLVAKLPVESGVEAGQDVPLGVPMDKLHLFDRESEKTLDT